MEAIFACMMTLTGLANSNMLSEFFREQRMLPRQPNVGKISQHCNKLGRNFGSIGKLPSKFVFRGYVYG